MANPIVFREVNMPSFSEANNLIHLGMEYANKSVKGLTDAWNTAVKAVEDNNHAKMQDGINQLSLLELQNNPQLAHDIITSVGLPTGNIYNAKVMSDYLNKRQDELINRAGNLEANMNASLRNTGETWNNALKAVELEARNAKRLQEEQQIKSDYLKDLAKAYYGFLTAEGADAVEAKKSAGVLLENNKALFDDVFNRGMFNNYVTQLNQAKQAHDEAIRAKKTAEAIAQQNANTRQTEVLSRIQHNNDKLGLEATKIDNSMMQFDANQKDKQLQGYVKTARDNLKAKGLPTDFIKEDGTPNSSVIFTSLTSVVKNKGNIQPTATLAFNDYLATPAGKNTLSYIPSSGVRDKIVKVLSGMKDLSDNEKILALKYATSGNFNQTLDFIRTDESDLQKDISNFINEHRKSQELKDRSNISAGINDVLSALTHIGYSSDSYLALNANEIKKSTIYDYLNPEQKKIVDSNLYTPTNLWTMPLLPPNLRNNITETTNPFNTATTGDKKPVLLSR